MEPTGTRPNPAGVATVETRVPVPPLRGGEGKHPAQASVLRAWSVLLDVTLLLIVIHEFQLVSRAFFNVAVLAAVGFAIHAQLPLRHRLPFFAGLSVTSLGVAFGLVDGAWLFVLGLTLLGLCHLPASFATRIALILAAGAALAVARAGLVATPWSGSIWPILGSMFMFRIALYLHALKHKQAPSSLTHGVSYFFMLPNVCFPLFPVVDYATFARTHFEGRALETYRTGVTWMWRGLLHLVLYRLVYLYFVVDPADIASLGVLVQHILSTFLLYLRVSGEFHLVVGMLHLFGFRMPETHKLYYLASSFTDFWRRINIYWKDFMMKLVYYPSFFRLRQRGPTQALVISTLIVFMATWLLHSYQWFWLRGDFPLTVPDGLFWGVLGALVVANALREARRGRNRMQGAAGWSAGLAVRTLLTFTALSILWSLWSAESASQWLFMWLAATRVDAWGIVLLAAVAAVFLGLGGRNWNAPVVRGADADPDGARAALRTRLLLVATVVIGFPGLYAGFLPAPAGLVASLQEPRLNARDRGIEHRGYYERMDNVERLSSQVWESVSTRPADWLPLTETPAWRQRDDFLAGDLAPSTSVSFYGASFQVNRWGMRHAEVEPAKPAGVRRVALLGPSIIMGTGMDDDETIAVHLESRLRDEFAGVGVTYEVLNFGISNYSIAQQAALLDERVLAFQPDVIIIVDSPRMTRPVVNHLLDVLYRAVPVPYDGLADQIRRAGVHQLGATGTPIPTETARRLARAAGRDVRMPWNEAEVRLRLAADDIVAWSLGHISERARAAGAAPVFVLMDVVNEGDYRSVPALPAARAAGFAVTDIRDVYNGHDRAALTIASWDRHPNGQANRLVADRLFDDLVRLQVINDPRAAAMNSPVEVP